MRGERIATLRPVAAHLAQPGEERRRAGIILEGIEDAKRLVRRDRYHGTERVRIDSHPAEFSEQLGKPLVIGHLDVDVCQFCATAGRYSVAPVAAIHRATGTPTPERSGAEAGYIHGRMAATRKIPHGSRPDEVYGRLRELIVQGQLEPGTRIIETEVAERLGVSRTPVREALQRLQQEGYVLASEHSQQSRLTVAPLTRDDVHELLNILGAVEGLAARAAALQEGSARAELVRRLDAANAEFLDAARTTSPEQSRLFEADERFHGSIVAAGAGPRLLSLHHAVKPQAERYIRTYISLLISDVTRSSGEHERIVEAISAGDAPAAQAAVEQNWRHAADRLGESIDRTGTRSD